MLNEFKSLMDALERTGYGLSAISPCISEISSVGLIICLRDDGSLGIKYFDKGYKLWNYAPNNQLAFPMGKITGPFFQTYFEDSEYFKLFKAKKIATSKKYESLCELVGRRPLIDNKDLLLKFWKRWKEYPKIIADIFVPQLDKEEPLAIILSKLSKGADFRVLEAQRILGLLTKELLNGCEEGRIPFELVQPLLVSENKPKEVIFFHDCNPSPLREEIKIQFNELVVKQNSISNDNGTCSLTGLSVPVIKSPNTFPQVNLPILGQKTVLLAMNKDVPCHLRHGVIAADICPVGIEIANKIAETLSTITNEEYNGKTWAGIPSVTKKKRDLLIVYCEEAPMNQIATAQCVGGDEEVEEDDEVDNQENKEKFLEETKKVIKGLKNILPDDKNGHLRCFILREIDPGRRQVVYSDTFTVDELFDSVDAWQKDGQNVPEISFSYSLKKGIPAQKHFPSSPSLSRSVKLFQTMWGSEISRPSDISGLSFHEILGLFLKRHNLKHSPREMLSMLVRRTEHLLSATGEAHHIHNSEKRNTSVKSKKLTLEIISMYGILLTRIGEYESKADDKHINLYNKELYMEDIYYNLGRFLMLIDRLHVEYCLNVRGGDVPAKLLGNTMIPVANANAVKALARLEERLCPYIGWAKRFINTRSKKENTDTSTSKDELKHNKKDRKRHVRWLFSEISRTFEPLKKADLPNRQLNDLEKAQLLLGYLSGYTKSQK